MRVDIWRVTYFRSPLRMKRLNEHIALHDSFQHHQIETATGCNFYTVDLIMKRAVEDGAMIEKIAIYNRNHPEVWIRVEEKIPSFPFYDDDNDEEIESEDQIFFEPIYIKSEDAKINGMEFFNST